MKNLKFLFLGIGLMAISITACEKAEMLKQNAELQTAENANKAVVEETEKVIGESLNESFNKKFERSDCECAPNVGDCPKGGSDCETNSIVKYTDAAIVDFNNAIEDGKAGIVEYFSRLERYTPFFPLIEQTNPEFIEKMVSGVYTAEKLEEADRTVYVFKKEQAGAVEEYVKILTH